MAVHECACARRVDARPIEFLEEARIVIVDRKARVREDETLKLASLEKIDPIRHAVHDRGVAQIAKRPHPRESDNKGSCAAS